MILAHLNDFFHALITFLTTRPVQSDRPNQMKRNIRGAGVTNSDSLYSNQCNKEAEDDDSGLLE